jgi:hypothetical protein
MNGILDRREAILERLLDLGQTHIPGLASAYRNHGPSETGFQGVPRPAFLLYDGGTKLTQDVLIHKQQRMPPTIWEMNPQILIILQDRDTIANQTMKGVDAPVGQELTNWANTINEIVTNDDVLVSLVTTNGTHFLEGIETDMMVGRSVGALGAWLLMLYRFRYPFFPSR